LQSPRSIDRFQRSDDNDEPGRGPSLICPMILKRFNVIISWYVRYQFLGLLGVFRKQQAAAINCRRRRQTGTVHRQLCLLAFRGFIDQAACTGKPIVKLRTDVPIAWSTLIDSGHIRPWHSVAKVSRNRLLVYLYLLHNETRLEEERCHMSMDGPSAACWQYVACCVSACHQLRPAASPSPRHWWHRAECCERFKHATGVTCGSPGFSTPQRHHEFKT